MSLPQPEISLLSRDSVPLTVLTHLPAGSPRGVAVLVHGLGENRTGLAYLHRLLSHTLVAGGVATYRFDLAGCGESMRCAPDLEAWTDEIEAVLELARAATGTDASVVVRGCGATAVSRTTAARVVAIGPPSKPALDTALAGVPGDLVVDQHGLDARTVAVLDALGVERECAGGLEVPERFLRLLRAWTPARWPETWVVTEPGRGEAPRFGADPLVRGFDERRQLAAWVRSIVAEPA